MTLSRTLMVTILAAVGGLTAVRGAPPPTVYFPTKPAATYAELQKEAPEALTIKVISAKVLDLKGTKPHPLTGRVTFNGRERDVKCSISTAKVEVTAEVAAVTRSASGLTRGSRITIVYTRQTQLHVENLAAMNGPWRWWEGPPEPPELAKGDKKPAYLARQKDGKYALAAEGMSFETAKGKR